jgi:glycosyltransferase involved in cell wall biosynthesis
MTIPPRTVVLSTSSVFAGGGLAVYARHLAEWLGSRHGAAVTVARFSREGVPVRAYARREHSRTTRAASGVEVRIVAPPIAMTPVLRSLSRTVDRRYLDPYTIATISAAFCGALERAIPADAEVVHYVGSAWELLGFAGLRVARRRGVAFTMWPAIHPGDWGDGPLDARLLVASDLVFAQSAHEVATLRALGVRSDRIRKSPLGPAVGPAGDSARFRAQHELADAPIVLFVGRKQRYKGFDALIGAIPIVQRDLPEARLVTIGSGQRPELESQAVLDLGEVDDRTKADALAACDAFCMPSSGEAFGMAYVEAWSYGKPVVVGPAPASRELVEEGGTGLHVEQEPNAIARALVDLLSDRALAHRMGEAGRRLQRERYTWEITWQVHHDGFTAARREAARDHARHVPPRRRH